MLHSPFSQAMCSKYVPQCNYFDRDEETVNVQQFTGHKMHRKTLLLFSLSVVAICGLLWGTELAFPKSIASMIVLIAIVVLGIWIARPGWNLRSSTFQPSWLVLFSLLLASAAAAAWLLVRFGIQLPYDFSTLRIAAAVPSILLITGIEELLFRQILYQWLKKRQVSSQFTVVATALAFGGAHLGPIFLGSSIGANFYLLQSAYMIWIGILLGQLRHTTDSWLMPWLGHASYNIVVLYVLSIFCCETRFANCNSIVTACDSILSRLCRDA